MANLNHKEFINCLNPFLIELGIDIYEHEKTDLLIESMRTSENTLKGVASNLVCYFKNVDTYNEKAIQKFVTSDQLLIDLKDKINDLCEEANFYFDENIEIEEKKWALLKILFKNKYLARKECILLPFKTLKKIVSK